MPTVRRKQRATAMPIGDRDHGEASRDSAAHQWFMTFSSKDRVFSSVVVLALAAVLAVLAVLQYRWIGQVSDAATERMQAGLQRSLMNIRQDLSRELARICLELIPQADSNLDARELAAHLQRWQQTNPHPELVSDVYVWQASSAAQPMRRLDALQQELVPVDWPVALGPLHERLQTISEQIMARPSPPQRKTLGRSVTGFSPSAYNNALNLY